jgi:hypothetical protein
MLTARESAEGLALFKASEPQFFGLRRVELDHEAIAKLAALVDTRRRKRIAAAT